MNRTALRPGSDEWLHVVSPSKVAAILGVSRWESPYSLWMRMAGRIGPVPEKEIFELGHDFEPAMARIWRRQNPGWRLSADEVQIVCDTKRFGFPAAVTLDRRACRGRARRIVEMKTARDLGEWGDFFTDQAPRDYVAQVIAQMLFSGYTKNPAHLMVLGPFHEAHTYVIPFEPDLAEEIVERCRVFWESLQLDEPPPLDDSVPCYDAVRELHPDISRGEIAEIDPADAVEVMQLDAALKETERLARGAKTRILDVMGNAQYAMCGDVKVADRRTHARGGVALVLATKNLNQVIDKQQGETA